MFTWRIHGPQESGKIHCCPTCCDGRLRPGWINVCSASNIPTLRTQCRSELESKRHPVKCLPYWMIDCACNKQHSHHQIAGSCQWKGHHIPVSKYAGFYPKTFTKAIVKGIISTRGGPIEVPVMHAEDFEPPAKRQKTDHGNDREDSEMPDPNSWNEILETVRQALPKSGELTWTNPMHPIVEGVRKVLPELRVGAVRAGKGLERYKAGDTGWVDELPIRYTVALKRFTHEIQNFRSGRMVHAFQNSTASKSLPKPCFDWCFCSKSKV